MTKTRTKRLLSLLLMLTMLLSCMAPAFAADAAVNSTALDPDEYADLVKAAVSYNDGTYEGTGAGFQNGEIKVKVTITDGKIAAVELVSQEKQTYWDNHDVASIFDEIVAANSPEVDGVSGATKSSDGVKAAVRDALSKAEAKTDPEPPQESVFASGTGTKTDPFVINNADQLTAFAKSVNDGESYKGQYVLLNANIDISDRQWTPIGASNGFGGSFDGQNHVISGLTIGSAEEPAEFEEAGLFGNLLSGGAIRNLGVSDASIINKTSVDPAVGALVAYAGSSTVIESCWTSGSISSNTTSNYYSYVGGIAGTTDTKSLICNSYSTVNVYAKGNDCSIGGIVGSTGNQSAVVNCAAFGNIENYGSDSNSYAAGGIVGYCSGVVYACYSDCTVHMDASSYEDGADVPVGGIVGSTPWLTAAYSCWFGSEKAQTYYGGDEVASPVAVGYDFVNYCEADQLNCEGLTSEQLSNGELLNLLTAALTDDEIAKAQKVFKDEQLLSDITLYAFYGMTENGWNSWETVGGKLLPTGAGEIPAEPDYFESGDGSADSPYIIKGEENLRRFTQAVNEGRLATASKYFKLAGDIALTQQWTPIENFAGSFDGDGYTVSGMVIGAESAPSELNSAGLFGTPAKNAVIKNLNITGAAIYVSRSGSKLADTVYAGVLVGGSDKAGSNVTIDNCTVSGSIVSAKSGMRAYAGGLAGYLGTTSYITNSIADIDVSAAASTNIAYAGGLAASMGSQSAVVNCAALGDVTAQGAALQYVQTKAGGLIASVPRLIENCYAAGNVAITYTGSYTGYAGLIAGEQSGSAIIDSHYYSAATLTVNGEKTDAVAVGRTPDSWYSGVEYNKITAQDNVGDKSFAKAMNNGASEESIAAADEYLISSGKFSGYTADGLAAMRPDTWNYWVVSDGKVVFGEPEAPVFASGTGTAEDPFIIKTEAQLRAFAATTNAAEPVDYQSQYVALDADISLTGDWTPIHKFAGTFDGRNHSVSNVTIGSKDSPAAIQSAGFFDVFANGACVKNLDLKNVNIYNSYNDGSWRCDNYAGALVGGASGTGTDAKIDNCSVTGGVVSACAVSGQSMAGGLVGYAYRNNSITNCVADISVYAKSTSSLAHGGGMVGVGAYVLYENCAALGDVYVEGDNMVANLSCKAGGFAGSTAGLLHNCYASGNVTLANAVKANTPVAGSFIGELTSGFAYGCYYDSKASVTASGEAVTNAFGTVNANNAVAEKVTSADTTASGFAATMNEGLKKASIAEADAWFIETANTAQATINAMRPSVWYAWTYANGGTILGNSEYVEPKEPDYSFFESGKGTAEDPWVIMNLDQLKKFAASFDETGYSGKYITLDADIDVSGETWTPIGQTSQAGKVRVFGGVFDGAGHKITGMTIGTEQSPITDTALYYSYGFFSMVSTSAVVKNLGIENAKIYVIGEQTVYAGMIAGFARASTIDGCWATGTLSVRTSEGDFANNCFGGGIAGYSEGCEILNSWTDVTINAWCKTANAEAGGIVGMSAFGLIANCYSLGDITGETDRTVDDGGVAYLGGIAGCQAGTIYNCYSTSNLTATSWSQHVGAIAGMATAISETYYSYYSDAVKVSIGGENIDPVVAVGKEVPAGYSEDTGKWMSGSYIVGAESVPASEIGTQALADKLNENFKRCPFKQSDITTELLTWVVSDGTVTFGTDKAELTYVEHTRPQEPKNYEYIDGTYYGRDDDEKVIVKITVEDKKVVSAQIVSPEDFDANADKVFEELIKDQTVEANASDENEKALRAAVTEALNKALIGDTSGYGPADPSEIFASGTGTAEDPFIIKTEAQLRAFAAAVNTDEHFYGEYIALDADIALHGAWMPVGSARAHFFSGTFDGRGHTISNMRIGSENAPLDYAAAGLFTDLESAVVKNLRIENASIYNKRSDNYSVYAGLISGMTGKLQNGCGTTINNCAVSGTIVNASDGWSYTGGITGYLTDSILINSSADISLTAVSGYYTALCGGLTGICSFAVVANNYALGSAYAEAGVNASSVGGIAGMSAACNANNYADVSVSSKNHTGDLGGIAGRNTAMGTVLYTYYNKDKIEKGIGTNVTMAGNTGYYSEVVGMTAAELRSQALADTLNDNQCEEKDLQSTLVSWISGYNITSREAKLTIDKWILDDGLVRQGNAPAAYDPDFAISVGGCKNGSVSVSADAAKAGTEITVTVKAAAGYKLKSISAAAGDAKVELSKGENGSYSFVMPEGDVVISAVFEKLPPMFTDVTEGMYCYDAVQWAASNGVAKGMTETTFEPDTVCTRAQAVTFLWRAAGSPMPKTAANPFSDVSESEYYYNAVLWAVENEITTGTTATTFSPNATAERAQVLTFLYRYAGSPEVSGENDFVDVPTGAYYYNAVQWAVENGVTKGMTATNFGPYLTATRGQIVSFIYRWFAK